MKTLDEEEDAEFRERFRQEFNVESPEDQWTAVDHKDGFRLEWEDADSFETQLEDTASIVGNVSDKVYVVAFPDAQYVPEDQEAFEEKYNSRIVEIRPEELPEIDGDLIEYHVVPEDLSWIVTVDHDGNFVFSGKPIEEKARERFGEQ